MKTRPNPKIRPNTTASRVRIIFLTPDEAIAQLGKLLILDVQNPKYVATTIPKAHRLHLDIHLKDIPKTQPILVTCLSGHRSLTAAQQLLQRGYGSVYVLKGGVMAWRQAGYTTQATRLLA